MKKLALLLVSLFGMTAGVAHADISATPQTAVYPGGCPKIAMVVDEEGVAVMQPAVAYEDGNDVVVTVFGDKFSIEKQFTIKSAVTGNKYGAEDEISLSRLWIESADLQSVVVSRNFFVKNNKWCVVLAYRPADGDEKLRVMDEDGVVLGELPESNQTPDIFLDGFFMGTPFLCAYISNGEDNETDFFQLYSFSGSAGIEANRVATFTNAYPNPLRAGQTLTVDFARPADDATYFSVVDMAGRQVYRRKVNYGENRYTLSDARFGHGHYVYTVVYRNGESVSGRLMFD